MKWISTAGFLVFLAFSLILSSSNPTYAQFT